MPSAVGHTDYDETLLASAPVATKSQLQSGYAADLLVDKKPAAPKRDLRPVQPDLEAGRNQVEKPTPKSTMEDSIPPKPPSSSPQVPFHRTRKGIIVIAVVTLVALAAIIGGAVGGTMSKRVSATSVPVTSGISNPQGGGTPTIVQPTDQLSGATQSPATPTRAGGGGGSEALGQATAESQRFSNGQVVGLAN